MWLADCIFDVAVTGETRFAEDAARAQPEVERLGNVTVESPLVAAVSGLRLADATTLLDAGADPDTRSSDGRPVLHLATLFGDVDAVQLLLDHGADPNLADDAGSTALHIAAFWGFDDVARILLENGADRHRRDGNGETPAEVATNLHHDALARTLE